MSEQAYGLAAIRAIIGLGNPGRQYMRTRHNIGFCVLDALVQSHQLSWRNLQNMEIAELRWNKEPFDSLAHLVYLVKPQTFMNNSGDIVPFLQQKGIKAEQILVVHDELEKPFGSVTCKKGGSAKGHNGLRSIIDRIGMDFWRLRVGIGRPVDKQDVPDYVLAPFVADENARMAAIMQESIRMIER